MRELVGDPREREAAEGLAEQPVLPSFDLRLGFARRVGDLALGLAPRPEARLDHEAGGDAEPLERRKRVDVELVLRRS
jgi:hypothetical protein